MGQSYKLVPEIGNETTESLLSGEIKVGIGLLISEHPGVPWDCTFTYPLTVKIIPL